MKTELKDTILREIMLSLGEAPLEAKVLKGGRLNHVYQLDTSRVLKIAIGEDRILELDKEIKVLMDIEALYLTTSKCQRRWCDWAHTPPPHSHGAGFALHTPWDYQKAGSWGF